jgi:hypothetical protein
LMDCGNAWNSGGGSQSSELWLVGEGFIDVGRNMWLERDRKLDCVGGECSRLEGFGVAAKGAGLGGVWGRIGTARPTSVCPRALSTFGRLNRLKRDILEVERSSLGARGFKGGRGFRAGADSAARSRMLAVERVNRHREVEAGSWWRLRMLAAGCSLDRSSGAMANVAKCGQLAGQYMKGRGTRRLVVADSKE